MTAAEIAHALGGGKVGGQWTARCLAHDDRKPSLSIREADDGKVLVKCFAGCEQAQVIAALKAPGLWPTKDSHHSKIVRPESRQPAQNQRDGESAGRTAAALKIWQSAAPATNTLATTCLHRGINITPPSSLRFQPTLPHPSGGIWPAMVAAPQIDQATVGDFPWR